MPSDLPSCPWGTLLWTPGPERQRAANLTRYEQWLAAARGLSFAGYVPLWRWSLEEPGEFWGSIAEFFEVLFHDRASEFLTLPATMPGTRWFPGATLNYAEQILSAERHPNRANPAVLFESESGPRQCQVLSRGELARQVACVADALRRLGVQPGDRVAGFLSNTPEALIAFLAAASIGAPWSNCPTEMSGQGVLDRLRQIEPVVLFAVDGYFYGGKTFDRRDVIREVTAGLPSLRQLVRVSRLESLRGAVSPAAGSVVEVAQWDDLVAPADPPPLVFEPLPFDHPLWILYSSGTTGAPKGIVHGHGGMILEQLKVSSLHLDLKPGDRYFWYTTSGWAMWNIMLGGLLLPDVAIFLYDGSPKHPDWSNLWERADRNGLTYFGAGAPYFLACAKAEIEPGTQFAFERLRAVGSTGAPLPPEGFAWVYAKVKQDILLGPISGGTDVCSAFVLSQPQWPVRAGEMQCAALGVRIEAWNDASQPVYGETGELVIPTPFPAMPVQLWNDPDGSRLRATYFEAHPGVWTHGDWIEMAAPSERLVIHGRSDATLNRGGVRMGTAEFYAVVEAIPGVREALVVHTEGPGVKDELLLFVAPAEEAAVDAALCAEIRRRLRADLSPRHVPDAIHAVPGIPRTQNGKKMEVPLKRLLCGQKCNLEGAADAGVFQWFVDFAQTRLSSGTDRL